MMHRLREAFGPDEIGLLLALGLIFGGLWFTWRPAGASLIVGLVVLWIYVPSRTTFLQQPITPPPRKPIRMPPPKAPNAAQVDEVRMRG
jgi:hypothetical protein